MPHFFNNPMPQSIVTISHAVNPTITEKLAKAIKALELIPDISHTYPIIAGVVTPTVVLRMQASQEKARAVVSIGAAHTVHVDNVKQ